MGTDRKKKDRGEGKRPNVAPEKAKGDKGEKGATPTEENDGKRSKDLNRWSREDALEAYKVLEELYQKSEEMRGDLRKSDTRKLKALEMVRLLSSVESGEVSFEEDQIIEECGEDWLPIVKRVAHLKRLFLEAVEAKERSLKDQTLMEKQGLKLRTDMARIKKEEAGRIQVIEEAGSKIANLLGKLDMRESELNELRKEGGGKKVIDKAREKGEKAADTARKLLAENKILRESFASAMKREEIYKRKLEVLIKECQGRGEALPWDRKVEKTVDPISTDWEEDVDNHYEEQDPTDGDETESFDGSEKKED